MYTAHMNHPNESILFILFVFRSCELYFVGQELIIIITTYKQQRISFLLCERISTGKLVADLNRWNMFLFELLESGKRVKKFSAKHI